MVVAAVVAMEATTVVGTAMATMAEAAVATQAAIAPTVVTVACLPGMAAAC